MLEVWWAFHHTEGFEGTGSWASKDHKSQSLLPLGGAVRAISPSPGKGVLWQLQSLGESLTDLITSLGWLPWGRQAGSLGTSRLVLPERARNSQPQSYPSVHLRLS